MEENGERGVQSKVGEEHSVASVSAVMKVWSSTTDVPVALLPLPRVPLPEQPGPRFRGRQVVREEVLVGHQGTVTHRQRLLPLAQPTFLPLEVLVRNLRIKLARIDYKSFFLCSSSVTRGTMSELASRAAFESLVALRRALVLLPLVHHLHLSPMIWEG